MAHVARQNCAYETAIFMESDEAMDELLGKCTEAERHIVRDFVQRMNMYNASDMDYMVYHTAIYFKDNLIRLLVKYDMAARYVIRTYVAPREKTQQPTMHVTMRRAPEIVEARSPRRYTS